jgi:hypothetical protein
MKRLVLVLGVVGLVGCFLPFGGGVSWFELRDLFGPVVWHVILALSVPVLVAWAQTDQTRPGAILALVGFGFPLNVFRWGAVDLVLNARSAVG